MRKQVVNSKKNSQETPFEESISAEKTSDDDSVSGDAELIAHMREEIQYLRRQVDSWRLQTEASNRALSEVSAALRKAIENNQKQLPAPKTEKEEEEISVPPQEETSSTDSQPSEDEPSITDAVTAERQDEQADSAIKAEPQQLTTNEPVKSTFIGRILRRLSGRQEN